MRPPQELGSRQQKPPQRTVFAKSTQHA